MKRQEEPIIAYLKRVGCKSLNSPEQAFSFMVKVLGSPEECMAVGDVIQARASRSEGYLGDEKFYEYKNETQRRSVGISLVYDNLFLREVGRKLAGFRSSFGKTILDVGCDNGILTCFLANLCPDSKILAIDRCASAIDCAKQHASALGILNVEFRVAVPEDLGDEAFETVFTSRTAHENYVDREYPWGRPVEEQLDILSDLFEGYAKTLRQRILPGGTLIAVSHIDLSVRYAGRMLSLVRQGLQFDSARWAEISTHHPLAPQGSKDDFQIAVLHEKPMTDEAYFNEVSNCFIKNGVRPDADTYEGNPVGWMFYCKIGVPVEGDRLFTTDGLFCGEYLICKDKFEEDYCWEYLNNNCGETLYLKQYPVSEKDKIRARIHDWTQRSLDCCDTMICKSVGENWKCQN